MSASVAHSPAVSTVPAAPTSRLFGVIAFASGLVFALGLGFGGMLQPSKVLGFLDVAGDWDPSLAFVMGGAIGVHFFFARRSLKAPKPLLATSFSWPTAKRIDVPLALGATLFGVGWGLVGYCPGPAIVSIVSAAPSALLFTATMLGTSVVTRRVMSHLRGKEGPSSKTLADVA